MASDDTPTFALQFARTAAYPCPYLSNQEARSLVAFPASRIDANAYDHLIQAGFRRSGDQVYRPDCKHCQACIAVRLPVDKLQTDRSQRRALKRHAELEARELPLLFVEEHYALYQRYQSTRHAGGSMDGESQEQYTRFLLESGVDSRLIEFREDNVLRMVSVIDVLADGLSSVYCFYAPEILNASFGTYNILWQMACCQRLGLSYLYLGYWIADCPKMAYKARFCPLETLIDGHWRQ